MYLDTIYATLYICTGAYVNVSGYMISTFLIKMYLQKMIFLIKFRVRHYNATDFFSFLIPNDIIFKQKI